MRPPLEPIPFHKWFWEGHNLRGYGKTRCSRRFWVAQRFTAAVTGLFSVSPLGAEGNCDSRGEFFRSALSRAARSQ